MKITILNMSVAVVIVLLMISCGGDIDLSTNRVSAKRNNVDWKGYTEVQLDEATNILTILGVANEPDSGVVVIKIKADGTGSYALTNEEGYYYTLTGGDVTSSEYTIAPTNVGHVTISRYEGKGGFIEGTFEMSMKKIRGLPNNNLDVCNFTHGSFRGKISN
jgi:hypothetical protein